MWRATDLPVEVTTTIALAQELIAALTAAMAVVWSFISWEGVAISIICRWLLNIAPSASRHIWSRKKKSFLNIWSRKKKKIVFWDNELDFSLHFKKKLYFTCTKVLTASSGWFPLAVSDDSITQSMPSNTELATSPASARVGRGCTVILSSIWKISSKRMERRSGLKFNVT